MKLVLITIVLNLFIIGCDDVLDVQDLNSLNASYVWNDASLANSYLVDLYAVLPGWPGYLDYEKFYSDEMLGVMLNGAVNEQSEKYFKWPYDEIRKINILLTQIGDGTIDENEKKLIVSQAKFLRAWHYFKMVVYHGGVPIITEPQSLEVDLFVSRSSTKETFDFILEDLDYAIDNLPNRYDGDNLGRIDKVIALAFKARVALYMASPQYHPDNPYNNEYWSNAYNVNKEAKEFLAGLGFGLYDSYKDIWLDEGNKEVVMAVVFSKVGKVGETTNGRREDYIRPLSVGLRGNRKEVPIWNLVEAYPMKDGYAPGESPNYNYNLQTFWENRDPRFNDVIVYNGTYYNGGVSENRRQYTDKEVALSQDRYGVSCAGFYNKKGLKLELTRGQLSTQDVDWIEIRYAEVLLNFAETACETGHESEAIEVLKSIRKRAGIDAGSSDMYGLKSGMTREELRDAIMFERRIEFTFEGKRFWDLRRTRRFAEIDGLEKEGCLPTIKDPSRIGEGKTYSLLPEDFNYSVEVFNYRDYKMYVPDKYYFFPILQSELETNKNLKQNIGWSGGTFDPIIH